MHIRTAFAAALLVGMVAGPVFAQSAAGAGDTGDRSPTQGDPGASPQQHRVKQTRARAVAIAKRDKQPAGTTNGNQPDRASAGGGGG